VTDLTTSLVLEMLAAKQRARDATAEPVVDIEIGGFERAAAVLHIYHPLKLRPYGLVAPDDTACRLDASSSPAIGWSQEGYRTLNPDVRARALAMLGSRKAIREALACNPDRLRTDVQEQFEAWLAGDLALAELSYDQLSSLRPLYQWGLESLGGLPGRIAFEAAVARRASVSLFEHLIDRSFVGRQAELQMLRDFVGVVDVTLWAKLRAFITVRRPPLVLWGPGGVGKTAVIGRFLLEHVEAPQKGWFPFAYLPFDTAKIDVRQPWTILAAAADQLTQQVAPNSESPEDRTRLDFAFISFRTALADYRDSRTVLNDRATSIESQSGRLTQTRTVEETLFAAFARWLHAVAQLSGERQQAPNVPVLLVFDTFEEVLYRTDEDLRGFWRMIDALTAAFPSLRVVISGRTAPRKQPPGHVQTETIRLEELTAADATEFLQRLGVADPAARTAIVKQVGRNPLTLRLAARAASEEDIGGTGLPKLKSLGFLAKVGAELVRGQLYRRILDRIHDEDIRTLAHPGMILRRVTPDLIRRVLGPCCGLSVSSDDEARALFEALKMEHALVRLDDEDTLRYREEVRGPMLGLLKRDRPRQVAELNQAAIDYYAARDAADPAERAEEIYHRMMADQDRAAIEGRWLEGVDRYLGSAIEEIPPAQRIWLASHMSIELDPETYRQADTADWEKLIGGKALELMRYDTPEQVIALLRQRTDRTPESPLFAIEIRALMSMNKFDEAQQVATAAIAQWPAVGNQGRLAELLWLGAQAAEHGGGKEDAVRLLEELVGVGDGLVSALPQMQALTELLALAPPARFADFASQLVSAFSRVTDQELDLERTLAMLAAARLGIDYPTVLMRVLRFVASDLSWRFVHKGQDGATLGLILDVLRKSANPAVAALVTRTEAHGLEGSEAAFLGSLLELALQTMDTATLEAVMIVLRSQDARLDAATLAGLTQYRESFELRATPEASI
jgi:tetratricopeptide (TPR) repeat protein